jgi:hexokinase
MTFYKCKSESNGFQVAVLNDTTGTLVKGVYDDKDCAIGLILGTGCNGAYLEKADKVV